MNDIKLLHLAVKISHFRALETVARCCCFALFSKYFSHRTWLIHSNPVTDKRDPKRPGINCLWKKRGLSEIVQRHPICHRSFEGSIEKRVNLKSPKKGAARTKEFLRRIIARCSAGSDWIPVPRYQIRGTNLCCDNDKSWYHEALKRISTLHRESCTWRIAQQTAAAARSIFIYTLRSMMSSTRW